MTNFKKYFAIAFLSIALTGVVTASTAEMTIFPQESSTKINSFTSYEVEIENVGTVKDVYSFTSSNPGEISIAPTEVELEPGQTETVNVWYNPKIDREEGRYSFTVSATSRASGNKYSTSGTVNVIKDHKVDVAVSESSRIGCRGEIVSYTVEVTNDGIQKEEFSLKTDFGQLSRNSVTLEDGETQEVTLTVSGEQELQRNFNVVAASKTSYAQDIQNLDFQVETCFASDASITPQQKDVAAFTDAEYEVTVRNTGTRGDTFVLSTTQGELDDSTLDIDGESTESTTLTVSPETLGQQTVRVTANSTVLSSAQASMNVYNGMNMEVSFEDQTVRACENEEAEFTAIIENTGEAEEEFLLQSTRGNLTDQDVELEPGEVEEVGIELDSSDFETGNHPVQLTTTAATFDQPEKTTSGTFAVENCWDLNMEVVPEVASAGENRSTIYEIRLNNPGTQENTYEISHEGPEWISIKPAQVTVGSGETETVYMYAGAPFQKEGEVEITANAVGNNVERSETVNLVIGEEVKEAIEKDNSITGRFASGFNNLVKGIGESDNLGKVAISIIAGAIITLAVLLREW